MWQWVATDHFDAVKDDTYLYPAENENGVLVPEPFHCNAIDVDANGNLLVSARNMDSIFYIEKSTGKVLSGRWAGPGTTKTTPRTSRSQIPFTASTTRASSAAGAPFAPAPGTGQISLYDDETAKPGPSRGVVYDVTVAAPNCTDPGNPTTSGATLAWQYEGTSSVPATGSFRVLSDGSRTIGWGTDTGGFVFSEVDVMGNDLLDFYFTDGLASYRAVKEPLTAFDLNVLRSTAGTPSPVLSAPIPSDGGLEPDGGSGDGSDENEAPVDDAGVADAGASEGGDDGSGAGESGLIP